MKKDFISIEELLDENAALKARVEQLEERLENIKHGYEGTCMTCEPVGMMNLELRRRLADFEQKENK